MDLTDRTVGHYRVLNRVGEGAMGVVYRAVDTRLERLVAIKFLPEHLWSDNSARARMKAEARAASSLDHPNIATIYEIGEAPDTGLYIAMAFYSGETLARRLRAGPLSLSQSLDIVTQVARGLSAAHQHGIVHRDIKPANIMLVPNGMVKILDFGVARMENLNLTRPGTLGTPAYIVGTPAYMAPEQIRCEKVDQRCDLWALGVLLLNMVTGKRPFRGNSIHDLANRILHEAPEIPPLPGPIQSALVKALSKTASERFQSANEFIRALGGGIAIPDPDAIPTIAMTGSLATLSSGTGSGTVARGATQTGLGIARKGEYRQVTLVSCELCEAASIESVCGLEHLREVQLGYETLCEAAAGRCGGEGVAQGDTEVRLHFGYPQAQEGDAVRAVTAGLEIVEGMAGLQESLRSRFPELAKCVLSVRVGIHTGSVIASGEGKQTGQRGMFGSVGTLASRIQRAAPGGAVWITADTLNLVRGYFTVKELGETSLGDGSRPVVLFSILGKTSAEDRLEAASVLTELVSRQLELGKLIEGWSETKDGHGQVVYLSGDAGIGKSRLVRALKEHLTNEQPLILEARASPYHLNSPLHPVLEMFGKMLHFERSDSPEKRLEKLRAFLAKLRFSLTDGLSVLASLLSLPLPPDLAVPKLEAQRQKEKNLLTVLRLVETLAAKRAVLWIFEDVHWVDPTTIELLGLVVGRTKPLSILSVLTARTGYSNPWTSHGNIKIIPIGRLSRREAELMIQRLAGNKTLPKEVIARLVENADGVPLYIEELTRNVLTSGVLSQTAEGYELVGPIATLALPSTLQDSLMARLDRLGDAKEVAQVASVLGRTFSQDWLQSICDLEPSLLRESLSRLVEADVLFRRGAASDGEYAFKHALIKDAAYKSMLRSTQLEYHEKFARSLEREFPEIAEAHPELVAHHFTDAGLYAEAITYWRRAGEDARRRSANIEAAAHYNSGLELTARLPEGLDRVQVELQLWTALASVQLATEGYAAPSVGHSFQRVKQLGQQAGLSRPLFDALQGEWAFLIVRAELKTALETADRLTEIAVGLGDPALRLEAVLRRGITLSIAGNLGEARQYLNEVDAGSVTHDHRGSAFLFGQDRLVACLCHLSLVICLQGEIGAAMKTAERAVSLARELGHPFSLAWAYLYAALVQLLLGDTQQTRDYAEALQAVSEEQGFSYRLAQSRVLRGWADAIEFQDETALTELREGITAAFATGARVYRPFYQALLAEAFLKVGLIDMALDAIDAELNSSERTAERVFEAELQRLRGETLARKNIHDHGEAIRLLNCAFEIARSQGAGLLELRALTSLASLQPARPEVLRQLSSLVARIDLDCGASVVESARGLIAGAAQSARSTTS